MSLSSIFASDKPLVIASHNDGKVREIGDMVMPLGIHVASAGAMKIPEPDEPFDTFAGNARHKAEHAVEAMKKQGMTLAALADDSGLVIPALGGAPGVYSARWQKKYGDYPATFAAIEEQLKAKGVENPEAHFICTLALCVPGQPTKLFEGRVDGHLTFPAKGGKGFGYDPIFVPDTLANHIPNDKKRTFGEMDKAEKHPISHRGHAFEQFVSYLRQAYTVPAIPRSASTRTIG